MRLNITDERVRQLIVNDPLAYRWYTLACRNGLTETQFLTELLLSKYNLPVSFGDPEAMTFEACKREADEFAKRYGLAEVR
jgi:hypothetical protein